MPACELFRFVAPMPERPALLAQSAAQQVLPLLIWGVVLLVVLSLAGMAILWIQRRLKPRGDKSSPPLSFEALEAMRASGQLSEDEFRRLRRITLSLDAEIDDQQQEKYTDRTLSPPSDGDDEDN